MPRKNKRHKMNPEARSSSLMGQELSPSGVALQVGPSTVVTPAVPTVIDPSNASKKIFVPSSESFKDAIEWSGFVDKTLIIEELLDGEDPIALVFAPKRSGKSLIVDTVKRFFEIEDNNLVKEQRESVNLEELEGLPNYKLFCRIGENGQIFGEKCQIMQKKALVEKHFGRQPVVHLNIKDIDERSEAAVEFRLRCAIHQLYVSHGYLATSSIKGEPSEKTKDRQYTCEAWANPETYQDKNDDDMYKLATNQGLQKIIEFLHGHYGRKVYILVDEFDGPTVKALMKKKSGVEVKAIGDVICSLLGAVLKGDTKTNHVLGALVTGVSYLASAGISTSLNNLNHYRYLQDSRFFPYYGLTETELDYLLENLIDKTEQDEVKKTIEDNYNGYFFIIKTKRKGVVKKRTFCIWSVLHFLRNYINQSSSEWEFWDGSSLLREIAAVLRNSNVAIEMLRLVGGGYHIFKPHAKVDAKGIAAIFQDTIDIVKGDIAVESELLFTFFLEQGFLSQTDEWERPKGSSDMAVRIPNREVSEAYKAMFKKYGTEIRRFDPRIMTACAQIIKNIAADSQCTDDKLRSRLGELYTYLSTLFETFEQMTYLRETCVQSLMYCTMIEAGFKECSPLKKFKITEDGKEPRRGEVDLWMLRHDDFAVIWEFGFDNKTADDALKETIEVVPPKDVAYVELLDQMGVTKYLLNGLSMNSKGKPSLSCLVNSRNFEDRIVFTSTP